MQEKVGSPEQAWDNRFILRDHLRESAVRAAHSLMPCVWSPGAKGSASTAVERLKQLVSLSDQ